MLVAHFSSIQIPAFNISWCRTFIFLFPFFISFTLRDAVSNLLNLKIEFGMGHLGDGNV